MTTPPVQQQATAWSLIDQQQRTSPPLDWSPARTPVLAIDSEKGGVGKSALAGGLVAVMAASGYRVLAADLDPRATLTAELDAEAGEFSINDLLYLDPAADPDELPELAGLAGQAVRPAGQAWGGAVDVLAAERVLAHRETDPAAGLEQRLTVSLRGVADRYDLVVLDLPPRAGGKLVAAGMVAATHVIYPATLDEDGLVGVRDARRTRKVMAHSGTDVTEIGVVRNVVATRTKLAAFYDDALAAEFGGLLPLVVPRRVIRQEARGGCVPITAATTADARELATAYTMVLNEVSRKVQ